MEFNFKNFIFLILGSLLLSCSNDDDIDPKTTSDLSIAVAATTNRPIANTSLTFTLIATNKGPMDATDVIVENKILSGYTFINAEPSLGTFDEETGIWTIGDFENGETAMLIIKVKVNETGEHNNKAIISGEQTDITPANNDITNVITLKPLTNDLLFTYEISKDPKPEVTITGLSKLWQDLSLPSKYDLIIPETIEGYPVTIINGSAFQNQDDLLSVSLPGSIKSIGSFAFSYCYALTTINIPNNVTSIDSYAFYYCESLKSLTLPNSVIELNTDAFYGCAALTNIILPNNLSKIESEVFYGCSSLAGVTIPNTVKSIGSNAFRGCNSLTSIEIPANVNEIGAGAFVDCAAFASFKVQESNANFIAVDGVLYDKNISKLLYYPNAKSGSFSIPNGVITIDQLSFSYSKNLTSITIPNSVVTIKSNAFRYCTALTSVTIPSNVKTIEYYAFSDNPNLKNVTINPLLPPTINITLLPFANCKSLTGLGAIKVPASSLNTYKTTSGWASYKDIMDVQ